MAAQHADRHPGTADRSAARHGGPVGWLHGDFSPYGQPACLAAAGRRAISSLA
ncbi:hypothetical protein ABT383_25460 [Streptomyces humidus]|uniref:hypothetical protein n=1 Tax=Streptomyces humidus TaxID=52259 RepID=UPI00167E2E24|nr:hypothetical protein [Streptomyces humidus]